MSRGSVASAALASLLALAGLAGCDLEPCGSLDLRAEDSTLPTFAAAQQRAVVAVADRPGVVQVLRPCATTQDCAERRLEVSLPEAAVPEQLMLTGSGRWLVYLLSNGDSGRIDLDTCTKDGCANPQAVGTRQPGELIGTLRGGDWVIFRTWNETSETKVKDSELWAVYAGDEAVEDPEFRIGAGLDLRVVAMGHRHLVARKTLGDGTDELYLVRVAPAFRVDNFGSSTRGDALLLAKGPEFRRVVITEGPSPAERGDPYEIDHEVPTDAQVIATSGEGADGRTMIFSVADLTQRANFPGEVITKLVPLEDIPGLSPISPDGSHLAYVTPSGALALRNLDTQRSCMVRSSTGSDHLLAGFAADATLYFEAEEERLVQGSPDRAEIVESVQALNPLTMDYSELSSGTGVWRLLAVPPRRDPETDEPWAVVSTPVGAQVVRANAVGRNLNYDEGNFVPRGEGLWMLEAEPSSDHTTLRVHELSAANTLEDLFSRQYAPRATVCVSTSQAVGHTTSTPWATRCSESDEPEQYLDNGWPEGEQVP